MPRHLRFTADLEIPDGMFNPRFEPVINLPAPVVNVQLPEQPAPVVHVETAPAQVHVAAPTVHVAGPVVPPAIVNVTLPKTTTSTRVLRDAEGRINQVVQTDQEIAK